jgi:hypothetical protein
MTVVCHRKVGVDIGALYFTIRDPLQWGSILRISNFPIKPLIHSVLSGSMKLCLEINIWLLFFLCILSSRKSGHKFHGGYEIRVGLFLDFTGPTCIQSLNSETEGLPVSEKFIIPVFSSYLLNSKDSTCQCLVAMILSPRILFPI